ncbi:hypothetical protein Ct61P_12216 [Colletotrichum tofieldiae]|nr:hypothetical protein Ct61P_12216 [Colletotrichum tofieldiae]
MSSLPLRASRLGRPRERSLRTFCHEAACAAGPSVESGGELGEENAGKAAVEAFNRLLDGLEVGNLQTGFEEVGVFGLERLGEDSAQRG